MHKKCFISWINEQKKIICEICRANYRNLIIKSKEPNFLEWIKKVSSLISYLIYLIYLIS